MWHVAVVVAINCA